jgi:dTDP-D-glucose 4,6-dehydratase
MSSVGIDGVTSRRMIFLQGGPWSMSETVLAMGGCGFIGSSFILRQMQQVPCIHPVNLDKLIYVGNLDNARDLANDPRHTSVQADVADRVAVDPVLRRENSGQVHRVGGGNEVGNMDLVHLFLHALAEQTGVPEETYSHLVTITPDRPEHNRRYAMDVAKLAATVGCCRRGSIEEALASVRVLAGSIVTGASLRTEST